MEGNGKGARIGFKGLDFLGIYEEGLMRILREEVNEDGQVQRNEGRSDLHL